MDQYQKSTAGFTAKPKKQSSGDAVHVLLWYVLPFILFNAALFYCVTAAPKVTVEVANSPDYLTTQVSLKIDSLFPTRSIKMAMDGAELALEKDGSRTYSTQVSKNGTLEVSVVNLNGMSSTTYEHVNVLDDTKPTFGQNPTIQDGVITICITDSQSGVNFDSIYALNSAGERLTPLTVDRSSNTLSFEMDPDGLRVFAQDMAGNEIEANFTSHKQGDTETLTGGIEPEDESADDSALQKDNGSSASSAKASSASSLSITGAN